ncbi:MAG: ABC transporter ATP-binding protein [Firmicutes bacterium]|nr:ABC transporter ATP-binding protein [Bacillota bacterium]
MSSLPCISTVQLDPEAEVELFRKFVSLSQGKTALLITHRLSSVMMADKLIVIENAQIVDEGTHEELLRKNGVYASLFNTQASKYRAV